MAERKDTLVVPTNLTRDILAGVTANADSVPVWELRDMASKAVLAGGNPNPYLVQFYGLLALPVFLVAMVMIAATVTLRFVRFGQLGRLILGGILSGFVLYTVTKLVTSLGATGLFRPCGGMVSINRGNSFRNQHIAPSGGRLMSPFSPVWRAAGSGVWRTANALCCAVVVSAGLALASRSPRHKRNNRRRHFWWRGCQSRCADAAGSRQSGLQQ
ncbi:MAG: LptF/LptG family permease [Nitratireductor sp.]